MSEAPQSTAPDLDAEYRQIREECGLLDRAGRFSITVGGSEAGEYLQGQVTNDVENLEPGSGCYAALLDRKGHLQADMRILRLEGDQFWIDTEEAAGPRVLKHLSMYKIGRDATVEAADRRIISLIGPGSIEVTGLAPGDEYASTTATIAGNECVVVATDLGLDVIAPADGAESVIAELESKKAVAVSEAARARSKPAPQSTSATGSSVRSAPLCFHRRTVRSAWRSCARKLNRERS